MKIDVIGIGLEGYSGLAETTKAIVDRATVIVGSDRHLSYVPQYQGKKIVLGNFRETIAQIKSLAPEENIVILTSGDPLFFGLGRLLISEFPPEMLNFYPHLSAVQIAFSRIKVSWQDAEIISAHGRSLDALDRALKAGENKIAILTDGKNNPSAIANFILSLDLPSDYDFWVCENLGGSEERVQQYELDAVKDDDFAALNVVILIRRDRDPENLSDLPQFGIPDAAFVSFPDRPGLMTKREVRILVLGELALQPNLTIWDIGAGTGSVSVEIARLFPSCQVFAIEKTAMGVSAIERNCHRFAVNNVSIVSGSAPERLQGLPAPDRVFIGGSGGNLDKILAACDRALPENGKLVLALATIEHLNSALNGLKDRHWHCELLQVQLSRSVAIAQLTRFSPLNPVTILTARREPQTKTYDIDSR